MNQQLNFVRELNVSAASGLVKIGPNFYVISDDENSLIYFTLDGAFHKVELMAGVLPEEKRARKKAKPDFEALCFGKDQIIALPSGSTENRMTGAWYNPNLKTKSTFT